MDGYATREEPLQAASEEERYAAWCDAHSMSTSILQLDFNFGESGDGDGAYHAARDVQ